MKLEYFFFVDKTLISNAVSKNKLQISRANLEIKYLKAINFFNLILISTLLN